MLILKFLNSKFQNGRHFFIFEVKTVACQNRNYIKWAESNKEQFGENQISISFFITEIC